MSEDPRLRACIALLEDAARRHPSSAVYHDLAGLLLDRGDGAAAAKACAQAVALDPDGARVEFAINGRQGNRYPPDVRRQRARLLMEHGFINSVVISQVAQASVVLGDGECVRSLMDYKRFHTCGFSAAASGLPLRKIADVFLDSHTRYDEPADRAIRHASRYDAIATTSEVPEIAALAHVLREAAEQFIGRFSGSRQTWHPFTASMPADFAIESWGVISGRGGYHKSHIHARAWASGVLYLVAPDCVADDIGRIGWLRVGPPDELKATAGPDWEERWIKPAPGLLVMMPAYFTHETFPMERDEERICVAFDIVPRHPGVG